MNRPALTSLILFSPLLVFVPNATIAAESPPAQSELRTMLLELKKEHEALAQRINDVEALLASNSSKNSELEPAVAVAEKLTAETVIADAAPPNEKKEKLSLSGDVQLRYESNISDDDGMARNRGVTRARLRAEYSVNEAMTVGAEISTGDSDDPNTAHVTLSNFVDDLEVSLSRLYAKIDLTDGLTLTGGKFANPFTRTDLVWDGDVNPQGVAVTYKFSPIPAVKINATGIYAIIDEASSGPDSDMLGGQLNISYSPNASWRFSSALSYYEYSLDSIAGADAGDFRSNLRNITGGYLSDFDLLNILASASYSGFGERWPVVLSGDFVHNYGAAEGDDNGYSAKINIGRASLVGDWQFAYGYSQVGIDAVLSAFSNDNLSIATNYQSHLLGVNYILFDHVALGATLYHYKPLEALYAGANDPDDWLDRLRLNMTVEF